MENSKGEMGKFEGRNGKFRMEKYEGGKFQGRNVKFRREKCKNSKFAVCILNGPNGPPYTLDDKRLRSLRKIFEERQLHEEQLDEETVLSRFSESLLTFE